MHRLSSICRLGAGAAILASLSSLASAQEPMPMPPSGGSGIMAPRTDAYSVYTDAFYNSQQRASTGAATAQAVSGLWRNPNRIHIYGGVDMLLYRRSKPVNRDLVTVTQNIFYRDPSSGQLNNNITNADYLGTGVGLNQNGFDLYPALNVNNQPAITYMNNVAIPNNVTGRYVAPGAMGTFFVGGPNSPGYYQRVMVNKLPNGQNNYGTTASAVAGQPNQNRQEIDSVVPQTIVSNVIPDGVLSPGQSLMKTDDFDNGQRVGYRPKIGLEFENGDRLEFSYMWFNDFKAPTLIKDVSGSAFLMHQLYDTLGGGTTGPYYYYQRFGYLSSPISMAMPSLNPNVQVDNPAWKFAGERRLSQTAPTVAPTTGPAYQVMLPVNPLKEVPQPVNAGLRPTANVITNPVQAYPLSTNGSANGSGNGAAPLFTGADLNGIRSASVPREPTVDDISLGLLTAAQAGGKYGNSFLWSDGELAVANYSFDLSGGELMYKHVYSPDWAITGWQLNLIGGVRQLRMNEQMSFFFADLAGQDTASLSGVNAQYPYDRDLANAAPNTIITQNGANQAITSVVGVPANNTTYALLSDTVRNNILGPEIGLEANFPFWSYFECNLMGRGGFVANWVSGRYILLRGDGFQYMDYTKTVLGSGGVLEGLIGGTFRPLPNIAIRGGFEYLLMMNVGTATTNLPTNIPTYDPNTGTLNGRRPAHGDSVLFTGWSFGAEVVY